MKMPTENIALLFIYENYDRKFFCVIFNGNCCGIKTNKIVFSHSSFLIQKTTTSLFYFNSNYPPPTNPATQPIDINQSPSRSVSFTPLVSFFYLASTPIFININSWGVLNEK
jgi:hypothetical protein